MRLSTVYFSKFARENPFWILHADCTDDKQKRSEIAVRVRLMNFIQHTIDVYEMLYKF